MRAEDMESLLREPCRLCKSWWICEDEKIEKRRCLEFNLDTDLECNINCRECYLYLLNLCQNYSLLDIAHGLTKLYLLNSPIITAEGDYTYRRIDKNEAKDIIEIAKDNNIEVISAIGHESTAQVLSLILGFNVQVNRASICMNLNEGAIVFRVLSRLPEGKILGVEELKNVNYELGFLFRR